MAILGIHVSFRGITRWVVEPTHLKNMRKSKWVHLPQIGAEKKSLKPPPSLRLRPLERDIFPQENSTLHFHEIFQGRRQISGKVYFSHPKSDTAKVSSEYPTIETSFSCNVFV